MSPHHWKLPCADRALLVVQTVQELFDWLPAARSQSYFFVITTGRGDHLKLMDER